MQKRAEKPDDGYFSVSAYTVKLDSKFPINSAYTNSTHSPDIKPAKSLHYHKSIELGYCQRGSGIFYIENKITAFFKGDVSIIMPGTIHIAQSNKNDISGWHFIDFDLENLFEEKTEAKALINDILENNQLFSGIISSKENEKLAPLFINLLESLGKRNIPPVQYRSAIRAAVMLIVLEIAELKKEKKDVEIKNDMEKVNPISPAIIYISRNFDKNISSSRLAELCNMSESSFRRIFFSAMGISPFEYIYNVRITTAVSLISKGTLSISEVAYAVGYQTLSSFNRHFKKITGRSPSFYKN